MSQFETMVDAIVKLQSKTIKDIKPIEWKKYINDKYVEGEKYELYANYFCFRYVISSNDKNKYIAWYEDMSETFPTGTATFSTILEAITWCEEHKNSFVMSLFKTI